MKTETIKRDHNTLEDLARGAGFTELFETDGTQIMQLPCYGALDEEATKKYAPEYATYWQATGLTMGLMHPEVGLEIKKIIQETRPRTNWQNAYQDLFTLVNPATGEFVDCHHRKSGPEIKIAIGKFPKEGEDGYNDKASSETNRVAHLMYIRTNYEPASITDLFHSDSPSLLMRAYVKGIVGLGLGCIGAGIGTLTYISTENPYLSLAAIPVVGLGLYKLLTSTVGEKALKSEGVLLNEEAIENLALRKDRINAISI